MTPLVKHGGGNIMFGAVTASGPRQLSLMQQWLLHCIGELDGKKSWDIDLLKR